MIFNVNFCTVTSYYLNLYLLIQYVPTWPLPSYLGIELWVFSFGSQSPFSGSIIKMLCKGADKLLLNLTQQTNSWLVSFHTYPAIRIIFEELGNAKSIWLMPLLFNNLHIRIIIKKLGKKSCNNYCIGMANMSAFLCNLVFHPF